MVKLVQTFEVDDEVFKAHGMALDTVEKTLIFDVLTSDDELRRLEKWEGLIHLGNGHFLMVNDNDGFGETRVLRFNDEGDLE